MQKEDRKRWLDMLDDRLSTEEVMDLVFDLELEWDNLGGKDTKRGRLRALIEYFERRADLATLQAAVTARRPDILPSDILLSSPQPAPPTWTPSSENWLDVVNLLANLVALLRLAQGDTGWGILLLLSAALAGGWRSRRVSRSALWRDPRWRVWAEAAFVGIPLALLVGVLGYHFYVRRQALIYAISLLLVGAAARVFYALVRQVRTPGE